MRKIIGLWVCAVALASVAGCDSTEVFDCSDICDTYDECVPEDVDVTDCIDRCEDVADLGDPAEDRVGACQNCYNDNACSQVCNDICAGIVPPL